MSLFAISLSAQTSEYKVFYFSGSPKIVDKKVETNLVRDRRKSGGVYRAVGDIIRDPFDDAMVVENYVVLNWANPKQKKLYLKIYDEESGEPVIDNYATTDSAFVVKFDDKIYQKGKKYSWIVSPTASDPDQGTILRTFTFADDEWKKEYQKEVDEINKTENDYLRKIKLIRLSLDRNIYPILEMY